MTATANGDTLTALVAPSGFAEEARLLRPPDDPERLPQVRPLLRLMAEARRRRVVSLPCAAKLHSLARSRSQRRLRPPASTGARTGCASAARRSAPYNPRLLRDA
jgi:hypothetical protein